MHQSARLTFSASLGIKLAAQKKGTNQFVCQIVGGRSTHFLVL
jgi:hypothetical protein